MGTWVTREVKIQEYGWIVKMRDASRKELMILNESDASKDIMPILRVLEGLIVEWDVTTRDGEQMAIYAESMLDLPNQVIAELLKPVFDHASGISNPKAGSASTPIMPPKLEELSPEQRQ